MDQGHVLSDGDPLSTVRTLGGPPGSGELLSSLLSAVQGLTGLLGLLGVAVEVSITSRARLTMDGTGYPTLATEMRHPPRWQTPVRAVMGSVAGAGWTIGWQSQQLPPRVPVPLLPPMAATGSARLGTSLNLLSLVSLLDTLIGQVLDVALVPAVDGAGGEARGAGCSVSGRRRAGGHRIQAELLARAQHGYVQRAGSGWCRVHTSQPARRNYPASSFPGPSWFLQLGYIRLLLPASPAERPRQQHHCSKGLQVLGQKMLRFWCLVLATGLLPPSQGLLNLGSVLGLSPAQSKDGLLGTGLGSEGLLNQKSGLLGTGLFGEDGLPGTGILSTGSPSGKGSGGSSDAGKESGSSGILGTGLLGGQPGSSGLLGTGVLGGDGLLGTGVLGGDGLLGTGVLGGEGLGNGLGSALLGNASLLGQKGLLGTELLGKGGLLGNGSLLGLDGVLGAGGLLGGGVPGTPTHFSWLKVLNLENVRVSCRVVHGSEFVLSLYSKLVLRLPGIFQFLSGSSVETNITSHMALTQDTPGDLKLVSKDCSNLLVGFKVNLRRG
ncbi:uncharacterized protein LOC133262648 [Pezoporus flaviventris]|uniref:uncharacterized protein LOC133262648 n=1 Tax=Pezoporus flaviventris TaxID=889875 RepID=UPI002AAF241A|nr:uncharacterized protein LOC133262648 [Pezoporus flaviventris]